MLQEPSVPFHLIYSAEDLCRVHGCKWCASMKPWIERTQKKTKLSTMSAPKLDVHAPEFVPAAVRVSVPTTEIYATPKQPNFVSKIHGGDGARSDFGRRFKARVSIHESSQHVKLKEVLDHSLTSVSGGNKDAFGIGHEQSSLEPLRRAESCAAIDAKAWELATETFNESLIECAPRVVQNSGRIIADNVVQRINDCEEVMMRMAQDAMDKMTRLKGENNDPPPVDLLLDMRLDTIATILEMKKEEVQAMQVAKARARAEEDALRIEMENACHIFDALENQLQGLHREAGRLREETAKMRAVVF